MITTSDIEKAVELLDIQDSSVCVHSSLKSFGDTLEDGCNTLLNGFLNKGCTVVVPSFTYDFTVRPAAGQMPEQNGCDYTEFMRELPETTPIFNKADNNISRKDMGAFSAFIVNKEGRVRGSHPINSFSAIGPKAKGIVGGQSPEDVYSPFNKMYDKGGYVLLIGVNLCEATAIHYAEQLAGRSLFIRWSLSERGEVIPVRVGSCSNGFKNLEPYLAPLLKKVTVGRSTWQCISVKNMVEICKEVIIRNPEITHCGDQCCMRCRDAVKGGPK